MEKKKLLITASTFPRWENDTEPRFILDFAKAMTEYMDVTVMVPASPGAEDEELLEGVKVRRFHYFPIHKWETLCYPGAIVPRIKQKKIRIFLVPCLMLAERRVFKKESPKYDLVHAHWILPQGIAQSKITSTPYIVTGHGGDVTSLNVWPLKKWKYETLKNAKAVTVVSNALCSFLFEKYPDLFPTTDCITKISMGCDTSSFSPANREERYLHRLVDSSSDRKAILFVGRLAEKKGVKYLIEAMRNLPECDLFITGSGPLEDELHKQSEEINELYGERHVFFLGPKTHKELVPIYSSADILVVPSVVAKDGDREGLGLTILEAMASGTPVVAFDSGGISQVVIDKQTGLLAEEKNSVQLADKIERVLSDTDLRNKLVTNAFEIVKEYDYAEIAKKYAALYEDICDTSSQEEV